MPARKVRGIPTPLARGRDRFRAWRRTRSRGTRIPEQLWKLAAKLAEAHGLARTASVLKLDYYALKKRVEATGSMSDDDTVATFVELAPPASSGFRECILELEDPGGAKMRVHLKGVEAPDLAALSRSFWGVET